MKKLRFKILIERDEDGMFIASVPQLPGCHTQGETYEKAIKNIEDAIRLCLEVAREDPDYARRITLAPIPSFMGIADLEVRAPAFA